MADLTYSQLESLTYSQLEGMTYALDGGTSGGDTGADSGGSETVAACIWTESRISAIESQLAGIVSTLSGLASSQTAVSNAVSNVPSKVWAYASRTLTSSQSIDTSTLATSAEITALAGGRTLADLATPADVPTASQNANSVWSAGTRTLTAAGSSGLATASSLSKLKAVADETNDSVNALKIDITQALGLIANWTLSGSTLTAYDGDGAVLGTWTVTKSAEGSIIGVTPQ